jgi:hypothetical protein
LSVTLSDKRRAVVRRVVTRRSDDLVRLLRKRPFVIAVSHSRDLFQILRRVVLSPRTRLRRQPDDVPVGIAFCQKIVRLDPFDDGGKARVEHLDLTDKPVKCNRGRATRHVVFDRRLLYVCRIADTSFLHTRIRRNRNRHRIASRYCELRNCMFYLRDPII